MEQGLGGLEGGKGRGGGSNENFFYKRDVNKHCLILSSVYHNFKHFDNEETHVDNKFKHKQDHIL